MSRSLVRGLVRWIVVTLLLGQLAIASYACPALRANAVDVAQDSAIGVDCVMSAPDHVVLADSDAPTSTIDGDSPNLCAEHCKYGQQSDQTNNVNVPVAAPSTSFENNPPRLVESRLRPTASVLSALLSTCPPHTILHCVRRS